MKWSPYDVVVVGGGHAGAEAAAASANMGAKTLLVTLNIDTICQMSCNPAMGGVAKGQIVREIDALGGYSGIVTDKSMIQFRMLNLSKGPAMWSPRAQCDKAQFSLNWRKVLENTPNLSIWQDEVVDIVIHDGVACGVITRMGVEVPARAVILTNGTFLNGTIFIGEKSWSGGRIGERSSLGLSDRLKEYGFAVERLKTGTPVRLDKRSIDFSKLRQQDGEHRPYKFSYMGNTAIYSPHLQREVKSLPQLPCWECYTNPAVHEILRSGLQDSPLYNGQIQSIGPRYCPSIETKLVTFPDREQHLLFLEPEGAETNEMYLNGFSSSLPMDVQIDALQKIPGLEQARVYRPGYAIEYDFFDPTQLRHTLESKIISHLFFAGQVNGTTGYEEAAGQGLVAGINAALKCVGTEEFVMKRDESYIGVLVDDLVTKGVDEPYRMFTSRAEYRILLRQDDADRRLTERSFELGLATKERYDWWMEKKRRIEEIERFCKDFPIKPKLINGQLEALGTTPLQFGVKLEDLVARPQLNLHNLSEIIPELKELFDKLENRQQEIIEAAEIRIKYKGYIEREKLVAEKMHRLENIRIKGHFNYNELNGLSTECRQKLTAIDPETLAQASRIPGVSPSDINVLLVLMGR